MTMFSGRDASVKVNGKDLERVTDIDIDQFQEHYTFRENYWSEPLVVPGETTSTMTISYMLDTDAEWMPTPGERGTLTVDFGAGDYKYELDGYFSSTNVSCGPDSIAHGTFEFVGNAVTVSEVDEDMARYWERVAYDFATTTFDYQRLDNAGIDVKLFKKLQKQFWEARDNFQHIGHTISLRPDVKPGPYLVGEASSEWEIFAPDEGAVVEDEMIESVYYFYAVNKKTRELWHTGPFIGEASHHDAHKKALLEYGSEIKAALGDSADIESWLQFVENYSVDDE